MRRMEDLSLVKKPAMSSTVRGACVVLTVLIPCTCGTLIHLTTSIRMIGLTVLDAVSISNIKMRRHPKRKSSFTVIIAELQSVENVLYLTLNEPDNTNQKNNLKLIIKKRMKQSTNTERKNLRKTLYKKQP